MAGIWFQYKLKVFKLNKYRLYIVLYKRSTASNGRFNRVFLLLAPQIVPIAILRYFCGTETHASQVPQFANIEILSFTLSLPLPHLAHCLFRIINNYIKCLAQLYDKPRHLGLNLTFFVLGMHLTHTHTHIHKVL